jgi:hypothetical protein
MIDALRAKHPPNELLAMMDMPKSSYFYQREAQRRPEKYTALRAWVKRMFAESRSCYGYRRIHAAIKGLSLSNDRLFRWNGRELGNRDQPRCGIG